MKLLISSLLFLTIIVFSACVSEEGARKHAEKGNALAAKAGMMPGMMWKAVVYSTDDKKSAELGHFESRDECHSATQAHIDEHQETPEGHLASACVVVSSGN